MLQLYFYLPLFFFFFNDTATTEIYTLSLHDALPILKGARIVDELPAAKKAIRLLGGGEAVVHPVELPGTEHRVIVEIPKVGRTAARYPRDPTAAKGKAIGCGWNE